MLGDFMLGFTKRAEDSSEESQKIKKLKHIGGGSLLGGLLAGALGAASRIGKPTIYRTKKRIHTKPGRPTTHWIARKSHSPAQRAMRTAPLGMLAGAVLGNELQKHSALSEDSTPPMLARTISKAGPRADDLTAESDRAKFETFKG
jgi:hypothetical protein